MKKLRIMCENKYNNALNEVPFFLNWNGFDSKLLLPLFFVKPEKVKSNSSKSFCPEKKTSRSFALNVDCFRN